MFAPTCQNGKWGSLSRVAPTGTMRAYQPYSLPMTYNFAADLQALRRQAALTQADCAHLLGVAYTRISKLESGQRQPSVRELSILCLIFNEDITETYKKVITSEARELGERLSIMPKCPKNWLNRRGRTNTINGVIARLSGFGNEP